MSTFFRLKQEKPWALLRMSRRQYETIKPWKKGTKPMERKQFEALLRDIMTDELYEHIKENADAEALLAGIFGEAALEE